MSFDIFLQRFDEEPSVATHEQVRAVLLSRSFRVLDQSGFYDVTLSDGLHVEFSASGLENGVDFDGCAFHIRGVSSDLFKFVWEVAVVGDMVILPAMEDFVPILSSQKQATSLPPDLRRDFPDPVVCRSSAELESLLTGGFSAWKKYRDQIAGRPG